MFHLFHGVIHIDHLKFFYMEDLLSILFHLLTYLIIHFYQFGSWIFVLYYYSYSSIYYIIYYMCIAHLYLFLS